MNGSLPMNAHRYALILAGGSGVRLWPLSRKRLPKQLIPLPDGESLLSKAVHRVRGLVPQENVYICAAEDQRQAILGAFTEKPNYIGEPAGRDTLAAIGLSSAVIASIDPEAQIAVFPADHLIEPVADFQSVVEQGYELVEQTERVLLTFGITPDRPATGYGYLELGEEVAGGRRVSQFHEKPDIETAKTYLKAGPESYLWNSGMFIWKASTILDCIRRYKPETFSALARIVAAWNSGEREKVLQSAYPALEKISIDFGVMETASRDTQVEVAALPMSLQWLDVGSWPSFGKAVEPDELGNRVSGSPALLRRSRNMLVVSNQPGHLIATLGCSDLIVVHTPDATLICNAADAEEVKKLHGEIGKMGGDKYL